MTANVRPCFGLRGIDGLLKLPNELLDVIALHLCGSRTILNLSRVNKRLCRIAQDAMMRRLCVPKGYGMKRVLEMLEASSADATSSVTHLDLTKYVCLAQDAGRRLTEQHEASRLS